MGAIYHRNVKYTGVNMPDDYSIIGPEEKTATASQAYAVGEHFVKDGYFCTAIAAIAQGATLTLNTNYKRESIAGALENAIQWVQGNVSNAKTLTITDTRITANSKIVAINGDNGTNDAVKYSTITATTGSITITFPVNTTATMYVAISNM